MPIIDIYLTTNDILFGGCVVSSGNANVYFPSFDTLKNNISPLYNGVNFKGLILNTSGFPLTPLSSTGSVLFQKNQYLSLNIDNYKFIRYDIVMDTTNSIANVYLN